MAESGGHWLNIAEAEKLTQSTLLPGVVDEDIKRGNPYALLPLVQANHTGTSIKWLRSNVTCQGDIVNISRGTTRTWTESVTYAAQEAILRGCNISRTLDKYIPSIYGTFNDYEEVVFKEMQDAMKKEIGDKVFYDDFTYDASSMQMDGLHAIAAESYGQVWDIDAAETALSLNSWRILLDEMKQGVDFWLAPFFVPRRLSAAREEKGFVGLATATAGNLGYITQMPNQWGEPQMFFGGKPIISSDFLVAEQVNTGLGSDARAKYTSGTKQYSIFGIKLGSKGLGEVDPGLRLAFGRMEDDDQVDFMSLEYFKQLETLVNTKGMSLTAFTALLPGSAMCVGRIFDFTDAAITV